MRSAFAAIVGLALACSGDGRPSPQSESDEEIRQAEERELERWEAAREARRERIRGLAESRDPDALPVLLDMATSAYRWEDGYPGNYGFTQSTAIANAYLLVESFRGPEPDAPRLRARAHVFLARPEVVRQLGSLLDSSETQRDTLGVLAVLPVPQFRSRIQSLAADRENWMAGLALSTLDDFERSSGLLDSRSDGGAGHPQDR